MLTMYDEPFAGLDPISLNVIAHLIRRLNLALSATSIIVTYDVTESLKVIDYAYLLYKGVVAAEGTAEELLASADPFVGQFIHARAAGPVAFHMEGPSYREDLGIGA
jgi:phospholipid/cholesterol/gamma-HCH transport system ATP-binding protein